jgi:serine/threonine protein kinase
VAFQAEARATSRLRHDGIVKLLDFGLIDSTTPYMVLEYASGQSLKETLAQNGSLEWQACVFIAKRLCAALGHAHEQGVFHRDVQPSNILVTREPDGSSGIKLIDFGIAKSVRSITGSTETDDMAGTPYYMSPDQGFGHKYDARSEVYSLGCVLFECLTGQPPFQGETALETLSMHAQRKTPSLSEAYRVSHVDSTSANEDFPQSLELLIEKCLAKNQEDRYQSMAEMLSTLEQISATYEDRPQSLPTDAQTTRVLKQKTVMIVVIGSLLMIGLLIAPLVTTSNRMPDTQSKILKAKPAFIPPETELKFREDKKPQSTTRPNLLTNINWAKDIEKNEPARPSIESLVHSAAIATAHKNYKLAIKCRRNLCEQMEQNDGVTLKLLVQESMLAGNLLNDKQTEQAAHEYLVVIDYANKLSKMNEPLSKQYISKFVSRAWYYLSRISSQNKKFDSAEIQMQKAIALFDDKNDSLKRDQIYLASMYGRLASANFSNHKYEPAIANQKKCISICKKYRLPGLDLQSKYLKIYETARNKLKN